MWLLMMWIESLRINSPISGRKEVFRLDFKKKSFYKTIDLNLKNLWRFKGPYFVESTLFLCRKKLHYLSIRGESCNCITNIHKSVHLWVLPVLTLVLRRSLNTATPRRLETKQIERSRSYIVTPPPLGLLSTG